MLYAPRMAHKHKTRAPKNLRLTVASLRGFGEHRRAKIGPQRSERMRAEQGRKRAPGLQVALSENWLVRRWAIPNTFYLFVLPWTARRKLNFFLFTLQQNL